MSRRHPLRHRPTRLPAWAALSVVVAGLAQAGSAAEGKAEQEWDLDTPIDIILVWVGEEESPPDQAPAAPATTQAGVAAPLDLDGLESRLRKTKAIGLFTKLELKNQVGELLDEVSAFHAHRSKLSLEQLEERFDLLVMKLLVLLQDDDPQLHHDIADARPALWATLSNPEQFAEVSGP